MREGDDTAFLFWVLYGGGGGGACRGMGLGRGGVDSNLVF